MKVYRTAGELPGSVIVSSVVISLGKEIFTRFILHNCSGTYTNVINSCFHGLKYQILVVFLGVDGDGAAFAGAASKGVFVGAVDFADDEFFAQESYQLFFTIDVF